MFGHDWEHGTAKVIDRKMIATMDASTTDKPKFGYVVDVQTPTGESFRGEVEDPHFPPDTYVNAQVGDEVAVLVDYKRQKVKLDKDDPARHTDPHALAHAADAKFAAELAAAPGSGSEQGSPQTGADGPTITIGGKVFQGPMDKAELQKRLAEAGKPAKED
jgi:hypothetical protein